MQIPVLRASRDAFLLSSAALVGIYILMAMAPDGVAAVSAVSGFASGLASPETIKLAAGFDMIIPLAYGAGFILLAIGLANDEKSRVIAFTVIFMTVVGMSLDLIENGMVLVHPEPGVVGVFPTLAKFGVLGSMGFILTLLLTPDIMTTRLANIVFRLITPLSLAANLMGLNGALTPWLLVPSLVFTFVFLAWIAHNEADLRS